MNLLHQLLKHDSWTTRELLILCQPLSDDELDREFDIGHRSLRATFEHVIRNTEVWSALIAQTAVTDVTQNDNSVERLLVRLQAASERLENAASAIQIENRWNETYVAPVDGIEKRFGTSVAHVITHSMHHRAQLLYLMRKIGLKDLPEGDVFSWESAECHSGM